METITADMAALHPSTDNSEILAKRFDLLVEDIGRLSTIAREENPNTPFILLGPQYGLLRSPTVLASSAPPGKNILNAPFEPARTPLDWLSRDAGVVDVFINDPLCFAQPQPTSFQSFLAAALRLSDAMRRGKIRTDLPVYLFSGGADLVGQQLEGVKTLIHRYRQAGLYDISHHFYSGGRHEMLNEINRGEVLTNLLSWISGLLER